MAKKVLILLLLALLLLGGCAYHVVEDQAIDKIGCALFSARAEENAADAARRAVELLKTAERNIKTPAPEVGLAALAVGSRGEAVSAFQKQIRLWGFSTGRADGIFGQQTKAAAVEIQKYLKNLGVYEGKANGSIDAHLQQMLLNGHFEVYQGEQARGDRGAEVTRIQTRLAALLYLDSAVDGQFGKATASALSYFQKGCGLAVTGVADEETQRRLFSDDAPVCDRPKNPYKLVVDTGRQQVLAYSWADGAYGQLARAMICSTGLSDSPTPKGTWKAGGPAGKWYYFEKFECWAQYAFRIYGPYLFHSVLFDEKDESTLRVGSVYKLGEPASHGCVRLSVEDAKWIYENCAAGIPIEII